MRWSRTFVVHTSFVAPVACSSAGSPGTSIGGSYGAGSSTVVTPAGGARAGSSSNTSGASSTALTPGSGGAQGLGGAHGSGGTPRATGGMSPSAGATGEGGLSGSSAPRGGAFASGGLPATGGSNFGATLTGGLSATGGAKASNTGTTGNGGTAAGGSSHATGATGGRVAIGGTISGGTSTGGTGGTSSGGTSGSSPTTVETLEIADVWSGHPVFFALVTRNDQQFVAYYDEQRRMTVASRTLGSNSWKYKVLPSTLGWDSHNYVAMALDSTNQIHVSGNMHGNPLVYFRSGAVLDIATLAASSMVGSQESAVTYPVFFNGPTGDLVFEYRDGTSGNGNTIFNTYSTSSRKWTRTLNSALLDGAASNMNA